MSTEEGEAGPGDSPQPQAAGMAEERCPICLDDFQDKAFITVCFHAYCFSCVVKAAEVSGNRCPMCKTSFRKVIHNVRANDDYDTYELPVYPSPDGLSSVELAMRRQTARDLDEALRTFRGYRTTVRSSSGRSHAPDGHGSARASRWDDRSGGAGVTVHINLPGSSRGGTYDITAGGGRSRGTAGRSRGAEFGRDVRRSRRCAPASYRRSVYSAGVHALPLEETGRRRRVNDISAAYFKRNPARTHRLGPWLSREFEALLGAEHVEFMMQLVLSLIDKVDLESEYFASHLEPFLNTRTAHFMHELVSFAKSPYDVIAYDGKVRYSWPDGRVPPSLAVGGASAGQGSSSGDTIAGPSSSSFPSSSSSSAGGSFQQRLFQEVVGAEASELEQSCYVVGSTSSSSPIVIHGSDSESERGEPEEGDVVTVTVGAAGDRFEGVIGGRVGGGASPNQDHGAHRDSEDEGFESTRHLEGKSGSCGSGCQHHTVQSDEDIVEPDAVADSNEVAGGSSHENSSQQVSLSRVKGDDSTTDRRHHTITAGAGTSGSAETHCVAASHQRLEWECPGGSGGDGDDRSEVVRSKGKGRLGSDGGKLKKKSSHKQRHHHSWDRTRHHRDSQSFDHHGSGGVKGKERRRRKRISRSSSMSPPRGKRHHRNSDHKRRHGHRTSDKEQKDTESSGEGPGTSHVTGESSEVLVQEARALEEEIRANKREILKSALKKERIELLHRNMHGSSLPVGGGVAGEGRDMPVGGDGRTDAMLRNELDQLNVEITSKKRQLLSVVKRMEDENSDSLL